MKKLLVFILPLFLFITQVVYSFPDVTKWLGIAAFSVQLIIAVVFVLVFGLNHIFSVWIPFKRFQDFDKTKLNLLDRESKKVINAYNEKGYSLRINVMLTRHAIISNLEPKEASKPHSKKLLFCPKLLKFHWVSRTMELEGDKQMILTANQGIAGEAYRTGEIRAADFTNTGPSNYNLNAEQLERTRNLKMVISCPIWEYDHERQRFADKIRGVVNFDSKSHQSEKLVTDDIYFSDLKERIYAFSTLCSYIF